MQQPPRCHLTLHWKLMRPLLGQCWSKSYMGCGIPRPLISSHPQILLRKKKFQNMHLSTLSSFLAALAFLVVPNYTSPMPFSEHKLEEINALRAEGVSEAAIAARFPRSLILPAGAPLANAQPYPIVHSTEVLDATGVEMTAKFRHAQGRKRRLTQSVGQRGQEMGARF
ncbi:hypothetical protein N7G274_003268 [Stereocaulon virgatum]|uniref:Uncharacterized protein n=1 Tax=Stereocaulon virgatum TaxID=373712 RepID=A0ABR4AE73_9LECA